MLFFKVIFLSNSNFKSEERFFYIIEQRKTTFVAHKSEKIFLKKKTFKMENVQKGQKVKYIEI